MPVYFRRCTKIDELFELGVDAVAVPRLADDASLPKITQYIYGKAGEEKVKMLYEANAGSDYCWTEHFPDIPADEYDEQCGEISGSDPTITVTEGCGLDFKYIFHIRMGLPEGHSTVTRSADPELFEALEDEIWDEDDWYVESSDECCDPDDKDCLILRRCYETALWCAQKRGVRSIAFPMLGAENNSGFPHSLAYYVAHTAPRTWLEKNSSYEQVGECPESVGGYSGQYRLKDEMEIWIIGPPYDYKWSFNPIPNVTAEPDERKRRFDVFERNLKERIESSGKSPEQFARDFIWSCFKDTKISHLDRLIDYDATKFKNGQLQKPALHRVIAIAVGLELDDFDRFTLIRCAGYKDYPSAGFDFDIEEAIAAGARDFDALTEALYDKGYKDDPLTAKVRGSKKGNKETR